MDSNKLALLRFDRFENTKAAAFRDCMTTFICSVGVDPALAYCSNDNWERWQVLVESLSVIFTLSFDEHSEAVVVGLEIGLGMLGLEAEDKAANWLLRRNRQVLSFSLSLIEMNRLVVLNFNHDIDHLNPNRFSEIILEMVARAIEIQKELAMFNLKPFAVC